MKWMVLSLSLVVGLGVGAPSARAETRSEIGVEVIRDVAYVKGEGADAARHKLDLYLPRGKKGFPLLLFLHGGGFKKGDRKDVAALGEALARQGVGVAAVGYRLYPQAKHPGQVQDVAAAFGWLRKNLARHGGQADRIFVGGHSAGAHLAALLGTDERYLKAQGASLKDVAGVVALSGAYRILEARKDVFGEEEARKQASPIHHVKTGLPPFFLAYADKDFPGQDKRTREFADALKERKIEVVVFEARGRDHSSLFNEIKAGDPTGQAILTFITRHARAVATPATRR